MKRALLATLSTIAGLVVLLGFKTTPVATTAATTSVDGAADPSTPGGSSATTREPDPSASSATTSEGSGAARSVTGQAYSTRYGDVQVQVTVVDARITDVTPVTLPSHSPRDVQINAAAAPVLEQEVLSAQSADVQMVSGATYTSQGYLASLQSALDQVTTSTDGQG